MKKFLPFAAAFLLLAASIICMVLLHTDETRSSDTFEDAVFVSIFDTEGGGA